MDDFDPALAAQEQQKRAMQQQALTGALTQPAPAMGAPAQAGFYAGGMQAPVGAPQQGILPPFQTPGSPQIFPIAKPIQGQGGGSTDSAGAAAAFA